MTFSEPIVTLIWHLCLSLGSSTVGNSFTCGTAINYLLVVKEREYFRMKSCIQIVWAQLSKLVMPLTDF